MPEVMETLGRHRLLPVVVIHDEAHADGLAEALVRGGLPLAEVTFRTEAATAAIRTMSRRHELLVGAGTVTTAGQVDQAHDAGARFVVSPGLSPSVVRRCAQLGLPVFPGVATATELLAALDEGVSTVKFFPAQTSGGPAAVRALAGPFPHVQFIPTGGVTPGNLNDYLALPHVVAVGGSWMVPAEAVQEGDLETVTALVREAVALVAATQGR
ncbi:MAG TPA: bifunctional 4-hydroxy-2-oxoglutarate aldolase/2-dehydro-3-deoxy-phosphogluconate aldolase [Actinomycetales bacterium]|nr:bifunctional 4-hydroxy-2-oxoglutarate aldolase/2-dehydro-3-deoxy-phosphogluconate aldolase [Actinomycetales bacterium]